MRKLAYILGAALLVLSAAACSRQELPGNETVTVRFNVAPATEAMIGTKSADAASQLLVGVFDASGNPLAGLEKVVSAGASGFSFDLSLVEALSYKVVLLAQSPNRYVNSASWTAASLKAVSLAGTGFSTENDDLFTASLTVNPADGNSVNVTLSRPLAQVNVATSASLDGITKARFEFPGLPATLDALTGETSGTQDIVVEGAPVGGTYADTYNFIGYAYVPARATATSITATVTLSNDSGPVRTKTIENLPLQRNRRTNVLGNI